MSRFLPLLLLAACTPWELPGRGEIDLDGPFWDPAVAAAADGVYVRLPATRTLLRITPDGEWTAVDLQGAEPDRIAVSPDGQTVLAWISWATCADDDKKITHVEDCNGDDLGRDHRLAIIKNGAVEVELDVPPQFTRLAFDESAGLAAVWLDPDAMDVEVDGLLNLTEVVFLDLVAGTATPTAVGFAASDVLFTGGSNPRAVVLSQSQVAVVDIDDGYDVTVTYPLTLSVDAELQPTDVVLTPDGAYALVSIQNSADLYVLDLEREYIDIVELDGVPSDLSVDGTVDRTVIVYGNARSVDVLEHEYFELSTYELDEAMRRIDGTGGSAVLWNDNQSTRDVYRFAVETGDVVEYRAPNPLIDLQLTTDQRYALATLAAGSGGDFYDRNYGLSIFDLADDDDPVTLAISGYPLGVRLVEVASPTALVLVDGDRVLYRLDLATAQADTIELEEPPVGIDALPDGTFVVTQDADLGLLTLLDPSTGEPLAQAAGFAATNLYADRGALVRRGEE